MEIKQDLTELFQDIVYFCGKVILKGIAGILGRIEISGKEKIPKGKPLIFLSNHNSVADPFFYGLTLDFRFIFLAKQWVFGIRFLGKLFQRLNFMQLAVIPVKGKKEKWHDNISRICQITRQRKRKSTLLAFPEGTVPEKGKIRSFKMWPAKVALQSGLTVIPCRIEGSYSFMPRLWVFRLPLKVKIVVGQPIDPSHFKNARRLIEEIRQKIINLGPK